MESGYNHTKFFLPFFHYHFPLKVVDIDDKQEIQKQLKNLPKEDVTQKFMYYPKDPDRLAMKLKIKFMMLVNSFNFIKVFCQSFIIICRKD